MLYYLHYQKTHTMKKSLLLATLLLCSTFYIFAQTSSEAGLFIGVANYMGDLAPKPIAANETQLAFGGQYRYMVHPKIGIKGSVSFAKISGADANKPTSSPDMNRRDWEMEAGILEVAIQGEYHFLGQSRFNNAGLYNRQASPYIGLGLGLTFGDAEVDTNGSNSARFPEADDTSSFIVFPVTLGIRFDITESLIMSGEFGLRATLSDYLDGISVNGNPDANDHYFLAGVSVLYLINADYGASATGY